MYVLQRRNRGLRTRPRDRQRGSHLAKPDSLGFTFAIGQRRGKTANKGVTGSRGVHRLDLGRLQVLETLPSANNAPWLPRVIMTLPAPALSSSVAAALAPSSESTVTPLKALASLSLGIK